MLHYFSSYFLRWGALFFGKSQGQYLSSDTLVILEPTHGSRNHPGVGGWSCGAPHFNSPAPIGTLQGNLFQAFTRFSERQKLRLRESRRSVTLTFNTGACVSSPETVSEPPRLSLQLNTDFPYRGRAVPAVSSLVPFLQFSATQMGTLLTQAPSASVCSWMNLRRRWEGF